MDAISLTASPSLKWYEVWRDVLLHPNAKTFERILDDPAASPRRAFLWAAMVGLFSGFLGLIIRQDFRIGWLIYTVIVGPVIAVLALALQALILHWFAGRNGGQGTYNRLVYALSAIGLSYGPIFAVFITVSTSIWILLILGMLIFDIFFLYLDMQAIKGAERLNNFDAFWTLFVPLIILFGLTFCAVTSLVLIAFAVQSGIH